MVSAYIIRVENAYKFKTIGLHGRPNFPIELIEFEHPGSHATEDLCCTYHVCISTCLSDFSLNEKKSSSHYGRDSLLLESYQTEP